MFVSSHWGFLCSGNKNSNLNFMSLYSKGRIFRVKLNFRNERFIFGGAYNGKTYFYVYETFDFIFIIIDLMARFYCGLFNNN